MSSAKKAKRQKGGGLRKSKRRYAAAEKPERLSLEALLEAVPFANEAAEISDQGEVCVVSLPLRKTWWMRPPVSWVLPYRESRRVQLDKLGTEVFRAVDGRRTVEEIVESFAAAHRLRFHEARLAVMQFLKMLAQRNIVALAVSKERTEREL